MANMAERAGILLRLRSGMPGVRIGGWRRGRRRLMMVSGVLRLGLRLLLLLRWGRLMVLMLRQHGGRSDQGKHCDG
jgi:hypothetical protein